jgi:hypothetical protein
VRLVRLVRLVCLDVVTHDVTLPTTTSLDSRTALSRFNQHRCVKVLHVGDADEA